MPVSSHARLRRVGETLVLNFLNENQGAIAGLASFAAFLTTLMLLMVTWRYTLYTKRIAEGASAPRLSAWLFAPAGNLVFLRLGNVGLGPALDITFTLRFDAIDEPIVLRWPLLVAKEFEDLKMPSTQDGVEAALRIPEVRQLGGVTVTTTCQALDGKPHESSDRIELEAILQSAISAQMMVTEDHPARVMVSLRNEVRGVNENLRTLVDSRRR